MVFSKLIHMDNLKMNSYVHKFHLLCKLNNYQCCFIISNFVVFKKKGKRLVSLWLNRNRFFFNVLELKAGLFGCLRHCVSYLPLNVDILIKLARFRVTLFEIKNIDKIIRYPFIVHLINAKTRYHTVKLLFQ